MVVRDYPGVNPKTLTEITNSLKRLRGYDLLVDKPGSDALENELRDEAYELFRIGIADAGLFAEYAEHWYDHARGRNFDSTKPYKNQFYKFVVERASAASAPQKHPERVEYAGYTIPKTEIVR